MKVPLLLRNLPRIQKLSSRITNCEFNKVKIARKFASWWAAMQTHTIEETFSCIKKGSGSKNLEINKFMQVKFKAMTRHLPLPSSTEVISIEPRKCRRLKEREEV